MAGNAPLGLMSIAQDPQLTPEELALANAHALQVQPADVESTLQRFVRAPTHINPAPATFGPTSTPSLDWVPGTPTGAPAPAPADPMMDPAAWNAAPPQSAPPGAQLRRQAQPAPRAASVGGGVGGFRGLLGKEEARRQAELDSASQGFTAANEKLGKASEALVGIQQAGLDAQARGTDAIVAARGAAQAQADKLTAEDQLARQAEAEAIDAEQKKIAAGYKQYADATIEDRRTPGQKMTAIFSVAFAGIGDALMALGGGQGNAQAQTMQLIQQQIERDADQQLEQLGRKREGLSQSERALQQFVATVGDKRAARQMLVQKTWEDLGHMAETLALKTQSELHRNTATELKAVADQQAAAANAAGMADAVTKAQERVQSLRDLGFELSLKQSLGTGKPKNAPAAYGLRQLAEGTPEDAKKAQEIAAGSAGIMDTIGQLKAMAAKGASLNPTERRIASRRVMSLGSQYNGVFGDGTAPNEAQLEALSDAFANPKEVNLSDVMREYETLEQDARSVTNAKMRPYGWALDSVDVRPE